MFNDNTALGGADANKAKPVFNTILLHNLQQPLLFQVCHNWRKIIWQYNYILILNHNNGAVIVHLVTTAQYSSGYSDLICAFDCDAIFTTFQLKNKYSCNILDQELFYFTNDFFYAPRGLTQPSRPRYAHCRSRDQYTARLPLLSYHGAAVDFLFNYKFFRLPNRALISSRAPSGCHADFGTGRERYKLTGNFSSQ